jgi:hypothetical protein
MNSERLFEHLMKLEYDLDHFESRKQFEDTIKKDVYLDMALDKVVSIASIINSINNRYNRH